VVVLTVLVAAAATVVPSVLVPFFAGRLSAAAGADVRIGWISWNPLAGQVVLHRVALAATRDAPPLATVRSITVDVAVRRWLDGERGLDALVLRRPWIALRRTGPGDFDLATMLHPRATSDPAAPPATDPGPPTPFRIARFEIQNGSIEFRDETTVPALETSLHLDDATARDLVLDTGGSGTVSFHIESRIEDEPLTLDVSYEGGQDASHLTVTLEASNASLARALLYVPLGWQRTSGTIDARITYERRVANATLRKHGLTAVLTLHDLALTEPWAKEPMLKAKTVRVPALTVDFVGQRTDLGAIQVTDFQTLVLRDDEGIHVALASGSPGAESSGWATRLDRVALGRGTAVLRRVLSADEPDVIIPVTEGTIRLPDDEVRFTFSGSLADGTITLDGNTRDAVTTLTFDFAKLALAKAPARFGLPVTFAEGRLDGTLELRLGKDTSTLSGSLQSRDARTTPSAAHPEEVLAWQRLEVVLGESGLDPLQLHVRHADVTWPYIMLHRRPDGWFPLTLAGSPGAASPLPALPPWLRLDRLGVQGGRIEFYDTTLPTPYGIDLTDLTASADSIAAGPLRIEHITLKGKFDELSPFELDGSVAPRETALTFGVDRLLLPPLNPYLGPLLGYEIRSGLARIASDVQLHGTALTAATDLVLSRFAMRAVGPDAVENTIGAPLSVTLALMKDTRGDIHLELPVHGDVAANQYRVGNLIREALGNALLGTVRGPLGWIRGMFRRDEGERFDLRPVPFPAGDATLGAEGDARVAELAKLLGRQTALRAVLIPEPSSADLAALRAGDPSASVEALGDLARRRATVVADRLVMGYAIAAARVTTEDWTPQEPRIEGEPGVDVQLLAN
jgi:hypothetical protein